MNPSACRKVRREVKTWIPYPSSLTSFHLKILFWLWAQGNTPEWQGTPLSLKTASEISEMKWKHLNTLFITSVKYSTTRSLKNRLIRHYLIVGHLYLKMRFNSLKIHIASANNFDCKDLTFHATSVAVLLNIFYDLYSFLVNLQETRQPGFAIIFFLVAG